MRARLLALAAVAATALSVGVAGAAGGAPSSSYCWQQPGTAPVYTPDAQPALSFCAPATGLQWAQSASYVWVQPGTALPQGLPVSPH